MENYSWLTEIIQFNTTEGFFTGLLYTRRQKCNLFLNNEGLNQITPRCRPLVT